MGERRSVAVAVDRTPRGNVEVWALGVGRFAVRAPGHEQIVTGYHQAHEAAHTIAEQLAAEAEGVAYP